MTSGSYLASLVGRGAESQEYDGDCHAENHFFKVLRTAVVLVVSAEVLFRNEEILRPFRLISYPLLRIYLAMTRTQNVVHRT
jgi:hypothetical protein